MPVTELEEFLVNRDPNFPDKWRIHPLNISELWKFALGNDWDITHDEHPELERLFDNFRSKWEEAEGVYGDDILICEVEVEYSFTVPPGARALKHGRHTWTDYNEFWHMVGSHAQPWKVVGGLIRTIRMVPIFERNHLGQLRRDGRGTQEGQEASV